jgi:predicted membrane protein
MKSELRRSVPGQVILGVFVIGLGVLFLLDNLNIFDFHRAISFWPAVLILMGVVKLLDTQSRNGILMGVVFTGLGVAMVLHQLGWLNLDWSTLLPLMAIGAGAVMVFRSLTGRRTVESAMKVDDGSDSVIEATALLGGFERRVTSQNFRGGEVTAVMGGCELDLRKSSIEGEAVINVFVAMGGITLKVPPDWTVILHGTPIMGGFDEKTIAPPNDSKRLIIKGYAIMGGVEVRN